MKRPFLGYYGVRFLLWEVYVALPCTILDRIAHHSLRRSTPFLNVNWSEPLSCAVAALSHAVSHPCPPRFLDKLGYTGSTLQLVNGLCLLSSFCLSRLVYGAYMVHLPLYLFCVIRNLIFDASRTSFSTRSTPCEGTFP